MAAMPQVHPVDEAPGIVASVERIDAWLAIAKAGDRFLYATRTCLPVGAAGAKRMRDLSDRGLVCLTRRRSEPEPTIFNYMATRTSVATALSRPERPRLVAPAVTLIEEEAAIVDALLPVLDRFARHGRPCPTDKQLATKAGLTEDAVKLGLKAMVASHLVLVRGCAPPTYRRVIILSTGSVTGISA